MKSIYFVTRVSAQYHKLLHEWAWYFHELKEVKMQPTSAITCDMHANVSNKMSLMHYHISVVSLSHEIQSNSPFKRTTSNKSTLWLLGYHIAMQYNCVILHGKGVGKYCCRNTCIIWIIIIKSYTKTTLHLEPSCSLHLLQSQLIIANNTHQGLHRGIQIVHCCCHGNQPQHHRCPSHWGQQAPEWLYMLWVCKEVKERLNNIDIQLQNMQSFIKPTMCVYQILYARLHRRQDYSIQLCPIHYILSIHAMVFPIDLHDKYFPTFLIS